MQAKTHLQLSVSLVAYCHTYEMLKPTIDCVLRTRLSLKLYIIDNSPSSLLGDQLPDDPRLEYRFQNRNLGYGTAHNIVMRDDNLAGTYHLVLNPDVTFEPGVLEKLYDFMEKNPDVGNIIPKVLYPDGRLQYLCKLLPTPMDWIGRIFIPVKAIQKRINENFEMHFADYDRIMNIPFLSGCFMFFRTSALREVGIFDENIFMYCEDADLNRRMFMKYRTLHYPEVTIYHAYSKGSYKNFRLLRIHIRGAIYYMNKWGWLFDKTRKRINREVKRKYTVKP